MKEDLYGKCREFLKGLGVENSLIPYHHCHYEPKDKPEVKCKVCNDGEFTSFRKPDGFGGVEVSKICPGCGDKIVPIIHIEKPVCWCEKGLILYVPLYAEILGEAVKVLYCPNCGKRLKIKYQEET